LRRILEFIVAILSIPILILAFLSLLAPQILMLYLIFIVTSGGLAYIIVRKPAVIDIGLSIGKPIARFTIHGKNFRINWLPIATLVDDDINPRTMLITGLIFLGGSFLAHNVSFYADGWPMLSVAKHPSKSTVQGIGIPKDWDKIYAQASIKVLEVKKDSPAHAAGLKYGDIINSINSVSHPSLVKAVQLLVNNDKVSLVINRIGIVKQVEMNREYSHTTNDRPFGMLLGANWKLSDKLYVSKVNINGQAFNDGLRPGDTITMSHLPNAYLSRGILASIPKNELHNKVIIQHHPFWSKNNPRITELTSKSITPEWMASCTIENLFERYRPTLWENLKMSTFRFIYGCFPLPGKGKRMSVETSPIGVSSNAFWQEVNTLADSLKLIGLYLLLVGIIGQLWGNTGIYALILLYIIYFWVFPLLRFSWADTMMLIKIQSIPYSVLFRNWAL
jgi:hypothetical protein